MGVVFRALDLHLDREVAIKVLPEGVLADESARRRFRREARALSRLSHPNIATVHHFDHVEGVDFLVMELVQGVTLEEVLLAGPLPEAEALRIAIQIAQGLCAAHEQGVLHRDIKPSNLLLLPDGLVKIVDFGLARLLESATAGGDESRGNRVAGTLAYLAPETVRGGQSDVAAELWATGVVLYEMLAGQRPFPQREAPLLVRAIAHEAPPSPRTLEPALSTAAERLALRLLAKDPHQRPASAAALLAELEAVAGATPGPPPKDESAGPWRWLAVLSAGLALACGVLWWNARSRPRIELAPDDWVLLADLENASGEMRFDHSLGVALAVSLAEDPDLHLLPPPRVRAALDRMEHASPGLDAVTARELCRREGVRLLVVPSLSRLGDSYLLGARVEAPGSGLTLTSRRVTARNEDELLDGLDRLAAALRQDLGQGARGLAAETAPLPAVTTASLRALEQFADGVELWQDQRYSEAVTAWAAAVAIDPGFAMAHAELGSAYAGPAFNDRPRAKTHFTAALANAARISDRERLRVRALAEDPLGHTQRAGELYELYLRAYPADTETRSDYAHLLMLAGEPQGAIEQLARVRLLQPRDAAALINLATCHVLLGEAAAALPFYGEAFALEPEWVKRGAFNHEYGFALAVAGDLDRAREAFSLALSDPATEARARRDLGLLELLEGRPRAAMAALAAAVDLDTGRGQALPAVRSRLFLAQARLAAGEAEGARRELAAAFAAMPAGAPAWLRARVAVEMARLGQTREASRTLVALEREADPADRVAASELLRLRAELALARGYSARGQVAGLLSELEQALAVPATPQRLLLLETTARCAEASRAEARATAAWRALHDGRGTALGWEAQAAWLASHEALARRLLAAGERTAGLALLDELLTLWSSGEPDAPDRRRLLVLRSELG